MKVAFWDNDWYPVYEPAEHSPFSSQTKPEFVLDLTTDEYNDFIDVYTRFKKWQDRLRENRR